MYAAAKNVLVAHGRAVKAFREGNFKTRAGAKIGITLDQMMYVPLHPISRLERILCDRKLEAELGIWADPIFKGHYPESLVKATKADPSGQQLVPFSDEEIKMIHGSADFLGINYYTSRAVNAESETDFKLVKVGIESGAYWLQPYPEGLVALFRWLNDRYVPLWPDLTFKVTENGYPSNTLDASWTKEGELNDQHRVENYKAHVNAVVECVNQGIPLDSYCAWTITDNFEWIAGYTERFGLIYVDLDDPERARTPKASYYWWKELLTGSK